MCQVTFFVSAALLFTASAELDQVDASSRGSTSLGTKLFGFRDTCSTLYFFGFDRTDSCRDDWMPEYGQNCRCERDGTARVAKFCQSGSTGAASSSSLLAL